MDIATFKTIKKHQTRFYRKNTIMKTRTIILGIIAAAITFFFACTKEEDPIIEQPTDTTVNDSTGDGDEESPAQFYIGEYDKSKNPPV